MKKILIFVLAAVLSLAMLFSVTACGDSEVVDPVTVTISQETASVEVGSTVTLTATASDESAITWSSSDTDVATVSGGVVTGVSAGTATITATSGDATATCTVTVTKTEDPTEEVTITISQETASVEVGSTITLTATTSDGSEVSWRSNKAGIATVENGVVTGVSAGTATITATSGELDIMEAKGREQNIRKVNLQEFNYFCTFTYDDKKHDEETFRRKLRRCLSNLHTRRGWRYMGVFERAPETGRLHFHGLLYVPDGEMLGKLEEKTDYSTAQGKMQTRNENSFFEQQYGRNDFEEITPSQLEYGDSVDYILKYIGKTNERIVYSRGIPTELCVTLTAKDILTELTNDFVLKYVIFDDVINWERDIARYRFSKQMSITDLLCNPSLVA